ncbi:MAG: hypothetical protein ACHREM_09360 [Polyangiales bacterium]
MSSPQDHNLQGDDSPSVPGFIATAVIVLGLFFVFIWNVSP